MGMIRKTVSIGTLGLVSFRSKQERLDRAEAALAEAETALRTERRDDGRPLLSTAADAVHEIGHAVASSARDLVDR
jgi:type II secretory pathway pseudopilin PulG